MRISGKHLGYRSAGLVDALDRFPDAQSIGNLIADSVRRGADFGHERVALVDPCDVTVVDCGWIDYGLKRENI